MQIIDRKTSSFGNFMSGLVRGGGTVRPVLVVAAHPDDEVIGAGELMGRLPEVALLHVTDGAPLDGKDALAAGFSSREEYAHARRLEARAALDVGGVRTVMFRTLGVPDQQASLRLLEITRRIARVLEELEPEAVITHPYEGGHPDHDATAFAVRCAWRMMRAREHRAPVLVEMTSYHNRSGCLAMGDFLPCGGMSWPFVFSVLARARKQRMLDCHATQQRTLRSLPAGNERFRPAPDYDFTRAPHAGTLFYEMFDWGMTGARWRMLAAAALEKLETAKWR